MTKRIAVALTLTASLLAMPAPAGANEITVGNCENGRLITTTHSDPITGDTRIVVCKPADPEWG